MSHYFEIAYAAASRRLALFTGTGFSKAVSKNAAPSWQALLERLIDFSSDPTKLKDAIFPSDGRLPIPLDEAAQIISIELDRVGRSIHAEAAALVGNIALDSDLPHTKKFFKNNELEVLTTNYDKLMEEIVGIDECISLAPGIPIARLKRRVMVYHLHASVDAPESMVITSDDYHRFLNAESYFSRKFSTILSENSLAILGYSLGDANLKAIVSESQKIMESYCLASNIFFISRSSVDQIVKDYYSHSYRIRVIDNLEIEEFFSLVNNEMPEARKKLKSTLENIEQVIRHNKKFTDVYLKKEDSFYEIMASIGAIGLSFNDARVVQLVGDVLGAKVSHTRATGAWEQYEYLARWLVYLLGTLNISGTSIEAKVLSAIEHSMNCMSNSKKLGYSWQSFQIWKSSWKSLIPANRSIVRKHIETNAGKADSLEVVRSH